MVSCFVRCIVLGCSLPLLAGCYMAAPIHIWEPPTLASTVNKQVVLQSVVGPKETAEAIKENLLASVPQDVGRKTTIVNSEDLLSGSYVRLASTTDQGPSDVALASIARRQGADYLLSGRVIPQPKPAETTPDEITKKTSPRTAAEEQQGIAKDNPRLTVSWRLMSIGDDPGVSGQPVVVDFASAIERYPDLGLLSDPDQVLNSAAAREAYRLITPSVNRHQVQLAVPYVMFGSGEVRRGNVAALKGQWAEAEQIWSAVLAKHPIQAAAAHNMALAATAGQDFSRAKKLARQAIRLQPTPLHKRTLVWIELRQREYHKSFNLPDPPEGWFVTN